MRPAVFALLLALRAPGANPQESAAAPTWAADEVRAIFSRSEMANTGLQGEAQSEELANTGGIAYRVPRDPNEGRDAYIKRVLKKRKPDHPNVKKDQWLTALWRQLYEDLSQRSDSLARIARDRKERAYFEQMAQQAKAAANALAGTLEITIEGLEGFFPPIPIADGEEPVTIGGQASVRGGVVNIEGIDRARFPNDQIPEKAVRTTRGAIKELFSAMKQYNVSASMIGQYEGAWRKNKGHLRAIIPAAAPALYLNELARAGIEAEMTTIHLMTMSKKGALRELPLQIQKAKPDKKKGKRPTKKAEPEAEMTEVSCADTLPMQRCAERITEARAGGAPLKYKLE
jgi:hypothetical protein